MSTIWVSALWFEFTYQKKLSVTFVFVCFYSLEDNMRTSIQGPLHKKTRKEEEFSASCVRKGDFFYFDIGRLRNFEFSAS